MRAAATTKRARAASGTPAESVGARVARFPSDGSLPRHSGGSASALLVSRPARRSHLLRPAWSLSRPWRPVSSECFKQCRYLHHPLRLLPAGATVAGRDSHPPREDAFARRTKGIQLQTLHEELIHFLIERLQERLDRAAQSVSSSAGSQSRSATTRASGCGTACGPSTSGRWRKPPACPPTAAARSSRPRITETASAHRYRRRSGLGSARRWRRTRPWETRQGCPG